MAKTGILAQSKPAATTNTLLYGAPTNASASAALTVSNDGTGAAYRVALKQFDQQLTLDAATYLFHPGDVITNYAFNIDTPITADDLTAGEVITSADGEKKAIFESYVVPDLTTIYVKEETLHRLTLTSVTGTIEVGETITAGSSPDTATATVFDTYEVSGTTYVWIGPETLAGAGTNIAAGDPVTFSGGGSGTVDTGGVGADENHFIFSLTTAGGTYAAYFQPTGVTGALFEVFDDRTYRFDVSDSSMTGRLFQLSDTAGGEFGPNGTFGDSDDGTEYTAGKTVNGTAGSAGAYVQYAFEGTALTGVVYFYDGNTGTPANSSYGGTDASGPRGFDITDAVTYVSIRVYNIEGTWANGVDTFEIGDNTYTVNTQTAGKWGYVRSQSGATLNVVRGLNSSAFAASDVFFDAPLQGDTRNTVTVSSVAVDRNATPVETLIVEDKTLAANTQDRITSLVVGPGEEIVVYSATQNNSFSLVGFEDTNTEFTLRHFDDAGE